MRVPKFIDAATAWIYSKGPNIIFGLIVLFIGLWVIKLIKRRIRERMTKHEVHSSLRPFFFSLSITTLYILLLILVMTIVGFQLTIFSTIIGGFTVAIGLALSGTFQNFAGGVLILLLKPFELDDYIVAQGAEGRVTSIQLFYTVVLTYDSRTVIIPNGKLFNEVTINLTREGRRRLDFEIKLGYVADTEKVIAVINEVILATPNVLHDIKPRVGVVAMEVDGVRYVVNAWVNPNDFLDTKIALHRAIIQKLLANGVKLPGMP